MTEYKGETGDLLLILEISSSLALHQDLQRLLEQIKQAAVRVLNCELASVFVYDASSNELFSMFADQNDKLHFPANAGIAGACYQSGQLINVAEAYHDPRFNPIIDLQTGFSTHNILAAPLFGDSGHKLGVLEVLNKKAGAFNEWDEFLLKVLSGQCGVAIHRQILMHEFAESQRIQHELSIAQGIQLSLIPASAPVIAGYDIAGWNQPAEATGGDFFDFHQLSGDQLLFILADVAGHGIGPALLAAECWALQRAAFSWMENYQSCLNRINTLICRNIPSDRFITAFTGLLNTGQHTLNYLSAGHGPVYLLRIAEQCIETLNVNCLPLGIFSGESYHHWSTISFKPGDILIAFTDGFFEWENAAGENYGGERICRLIQQNAALSAADIIDYVYRDLLIYGRDTRQQDDLTAVVIKRISGL